MPGAVITADFVVGVIHGIMKHLGCLLHRMSVQQGFTSAELQHIQDKMELIDRAVEAQSRPDCLEDAALPENEGNGQRSLRETSKGTRGSSRWAANAASIR